MNPGQKWFTHKNLKLVGILILLQAMPSVGFSLEQTIEFQKDVRPIFDKKCISCHACYDAPCQLKLEDDDGIHRGATKKPVYDGVRLKNAQPTRLGVDAFSVEEWRRLGFYSVFGKAGESRDGSGSIAKRLLTLARKNKIPDHAAIPESVNLEFARKYQCPTEESIDEYEGDNPFGGMPLAVSGLTDTEFSIISNWIESGSPVDKKAFKPTPGQAALIQSWELVLNRKDNRSRLVARYLFEHLFLAHLYFDNEEAYEDRTFFTLIRSRSSNALNPKPIDTIRPNHDPGSEFYYRLIPVTSAIIHKTHITYRFDQARIAEYQKLFFDPAWLTKSLPGYGYKERSNPFLTFKAIPSSSRYQFLLNDAEFFIRTFIRGPVCRGQIATDVIRDQFWVMFESPKSDQYAIDSEYRNKVTPLLGLPGETSNLLAGAAEWLSYQSDRNTYLDLRREHYNSAYPAGIDISHIWDGNGSNRNAHLSVFRHHNSASVVQGWQGDTPLTAWILDYPLFERAVYELVVGFNVFGSVAHQAQTRLYFDLIRNEAETSFLQLLPPGIRKETYENWYQDAGLLKTWLIYHDLDLDSPSAERYSSTGVKTEALDKIATRDARVICTQGSCDASNRELDGDILLDKIANHSASVLPAIRWLPEVTFVRVERNDTTFEVFTILRNRRHSNVAFMYGESLRYQQDLDSLTVVRGIVGSYPNLIFRLKEEDLSLFVKTFREIASEESFLEFKKRYAVRRMDPDFWDTLHGFTTYLARENPLEGGIFDMNRYEKW